MLLLFGIKIKNPFKAVAKLASAVVKPMAAIAKVVTNIPVVGQAALLVPGVGQALQGVQMADSLVKAVNSPDPKKRAAASAMVAQTRILAGQPPVPGAPRPPPVPPKVQKAALNGLSLMKQRTAALRTMKRYRVNPKTGMVRRIT